ncbi:hypothetical protein C6Y45_13500 [Alkalicoccus saliphilus]|uniref:Uncharacterized protein n=1 Tax=Alkalicoccus saliphilus TaxID=200989 RepID=A0A2T4U3R0_9BACI|nr:hypothetical protein C6Y45_13500 [Alkalicoccus saliphilus]
MRFERKAKFAVDGWRNTSLPTGRLAVEEIFSFLRDLPISFFHGPVSASFFHKKRKVLLFINGALYRVKPTPGQRHCGKRKYEDPPG